MSTLLTVEDLVDIIRDTASAADRSSEDQSFLDDLATVVADHLGGVPVGFSEQNGSCCVCIQADAPAAGPTLEKVSDNWEFIELRDLLNSSVDRMQMIDKALQVKRNIAEPVRTAISNLTQAFCDWDAVFQSTRNQFNNLYAESARTDPRLYSGKHCRACLSFDYVIDADYTVIAKIGDQCQGCGRYWAGEGWEAEKPLKKVSVCLEHISLETLLFTAYLLYEKRFCAIFPTEVLERHIPRFCSEGTWQDFLDELRRHVTLLHSDDGTQLYAPICAPWASQIVLMVKAEEEGLTLLMHANPCYAMVPADRVRGHKTVREALVGEKLTVTEFPGFIMAR